MPWEFTDDNKLRANGIIEQYPVGHQQAAAIPLLDIGMLNLDTILIYNRYLYIIHVYHQAHITSSHMQYACTLYFVEFITLQLANNLKFQYMLN